MHKWFSHWNLHLCGIIHCHVSGGKPNISGDVPSHQPCQPCRPCGPCTETRNTWRPQLAPSPEPCCLVPCWAPNISLDVSDHLILLRQKRNNKHEKNQEPYQQPYSCYSWLCSVGDLPMVLCLHTTASCSCWDLECAWNTPSAQRWRRPVRWFWDSVAARSAVRDLRWWRPTVRRHLGGWLMSFQLGKPNVSIINWHWKPWFLNGISGIKTIIYDNLWSFIPLKMDFESHGLSMFIPEYDESIIMVSKKNLVNHGILYLTFAGWNEHFHFDIWSFKKNNLFQVFFMTPISSPYRPHIFPYPLVISYSSRLKPLCP